MLFIVSMFAMATDPAAFTFLTVTKRPTLLAEFKPGDGGKTAVYMASWLSTAATKGRGEIG